MGYRTISGADQIEIAGAWRDTVSARAVMLAVILWLDSNAG